MQIMYNKNKFLTNLMTKLLVKMKFYKNNFLT